MSTKHERQTLYKSARWLKLRQAILQRTDGLCVRCLDKGRITEAKIIHHRRPWKDGRTKAERESLMWNEDNLEPLCNGCHNEAHHLLDPLKRETSEILSLIKE